MKISKFLEMLPYREGCIDFSDDKSVGKLVLTTDWDTQQTDDFSKKKKNYAHSL